MKRHLIEVDEVTATVLEARAEARGVTVSQLVAELVASNPAAVAVDRDHIAELDRRWAAMQSGAGSVPHADVVRWLRTWGKESFRP